MPRSERRGTQGTPRNTSAPSQPQLIAQSPVRFQTYDPTDTYRTHYNASHPDRQEEVEEAYEQPVFTERSPRRPHVDHALSRTITRRDTGEPMELQEMRSGPRRPLRMTRTETEIINTSESHPTALERIETHRSLHFGTVGSHVRSRASTKPSEKDLPAFGAGKPYPPDLPKREVYATVSPRNHQGTELIQRGRSML